MRLPLVLRIRKLIAFLDRENFLRLFGIIIVLILISAAGLAWFEKDIAYRDALWWSIVTLTTVGYGDISPVTFAGRAIGIVIMFLGIGILGMFTASIASIFVERKLKEERGMSSFDFEDHIIVCGWNNRARRTIAELRSDRRCALSPVVLIAPIETKPIDDENLWFIAGEVTEEHLRRAGIERAGTCIVLGDDTLEASARDAKAVLSTLTIESMNSAVYSIVELVDEANVRHCQRANADEIIVGAEFSSKLISRSAIDHGISKVMSEILSSQVGNDLLKISVPQDLVGKTFLEALSQIKMRQNAIVVGVQNSKDGEVLANPAHEYELRSGDHLILIAASGLRQDTAS